MLRNILLSIPLLLATVVCRGQNSDNIMNNAAIENIMTRVSVRSFKDTPVEEAKIETMLRAAMAAPTAMNRQPWHFVVVTDSEKLSAIQQYASPLAIVVCGDKSKSTGGREFWPTDAALASENILLAAHALGLGAVWTAVYPSEERMKRVIEALNLPENLIPLNTLIIGYAKETPKPKDKWKPENVSRF